VSVDIIVEDEEYKRDGEEAIGSGVYLKPPIEGLEGWEEN
jgi:hypothetical protein